MTPNTYAVMHKTTGLLFAGFAPDHSPKWTDDRCRAVVYVDPRAAESQAILFTRFGVRAQRKPVTAMKNTPNTPAGWFEGPYGAMRANPVFKVTGPHAVAWQIPVFTADQIAAALPTPAAVQAVIDAMRADPAYAWSWHCNIAMAFVDEGGDHAMANRAAARFMRLLANVEPAHELPGVSLPATGGTTP